MQSRRRGGDQSKPHKVVALGIPVHDRSSPFITGGNPMYTSEPQAFLPVRTTAVVVVRELLVVAWLICAWVLPARAGFFRNHTAHVAIIHAGLSVLTWLAAWIVQAVHNRVLSAGYIKFNRLTAWLRHSTPMIASAVNVALVIILALAKDFTSADTNEDLTSKALLAVRVVAIVETVLCIGLAALYLYRVRKHNVAQALPEARQAKSVNNGYQPPTPGGSGGGAADQTMMSAASSSTYNQQRANEVIAYLQQREDDLVFQVNNLTQQLEAQVARPVHGGEGDDVEGGRQPSGERAREAIRQLQEAQEQLRQQSQDMRQHAAEVQRLRTALRDERRKNEKLQLTLEIEKEANAQAQRVIEGIRNLDASDLSDAGARTSDFGGGYSPPASSGYSGRPPRP